MAKSGKPQYLPDVEYLVSCHLALEEFKIRNEIANAQLSTEEPIVRQSVAQRGLTQVAAAKYVGVSPSTIKKWKNEGEIEPRIHIGRRKLYDRGDLDKLIERKKRKSK